MLGLGFRAEGFLGLRGVRGRSRVYDLWFRVLGLGASGLGLRVWGLECRGAPFWVQGEKPWETNVACYLAPRS